MLPALPALQPTCSPRAARSWCAAQRSRAAPPLPPLPPARLPAGFQITDGAEFLPTLERALEMEGPVVIAVNVDYSQNRCAAAPRRQPAAATATSAMGLCGLCGRSRGRPIVGGMQQRARRHGRRGGGRGDGAAGGALASGALQAPRVMARTIPHAPRVPPGLRCSAAHPTLQPCLPALAASSSRTRLRSASTERVDAPMAWVNPTAAPACMRSGPVGASAAGRCLRSPSAARHSWRRLAAERDLSGSCGHGRCIRTCPQPFAPPSVMLASFHL